MSHPLLPSKDWKFVEIFESLEEAIRDFEA